MKETLKELRDTLTPLYGKRETEAIIRLIFHHLKGWNLTEMLIHGEDELSPFIKDQIQKILQRLIKFEPIQYITGEARFHGMNLKIKPGVLIPRPETDELTDFIIKENEDKEDLKILDLCTGSGCIAIALKRNLKFPDVTALDISQKAIEVAEENASDLKAKINFVKDDIFKWVPEDKFDIIVSNPPYVDESEGKDMDKNVLNYEPADAIFVSDENPLSFYERIAEIAKSSLNADGSLYLEINPRHSQELKEMLEEKGFKNINIVLDSFGKKRFIKCSIN